MRIAEVHVPLTARLDDGVWPAHRGTGPMLDYDTSENPFIRDILLDPPSLVDGCFDVTDTPGLGVTLDEDRLDRFRTA